MNIVRRSTLYSSILKRHLVYGLESCYSTSAADSTSTPDPSADKAGFGFTEEDLKNAKPFKDIPCPKSYPVVGNLFEFKPFGKLDFFDRIVVGDILVKKYGDVVRFELPFLPIASEFLSIYDPEDFEIVYRNEGRYPLREQDYFFLKYRSERGHSEGLFISSGDEWWRFRQPLNPLMMRVNAAKPYVQVQDTIGDDFVKKIRNRECSQNDTLHRTFMKDIYKYAFESVGAIVYDRRIGCLDADLSPTSWQEKFITSVLFTLKAAITFNLNPFYKLFLERGYKLKKYKEWEAAMDHVFETSQRLMLESKEMWKDVPEEVLQTKFLPQMLNIESLSITDKNTAIFDFFFAALDTTMYTTVYNCFFLAKNPLIQEKLLSEINTHSPKGTALTAAALDKMQYLRACIKESARIKPISFIINRTLLRDIVIKGYRIPEGAMVFMEHLYSSNDAKYVKDPDTYKPERWLRSETSEKQHPFLSLPFGFGPRSCIGRRFAEQEVEVVLIKLLQNFKIEFDGDTLPLRGLGGDKLPMDLDFRFIER